jgi:hypothetical protein
MSTSKPRLTIRNAILVLACIAFVLPVCFSLFTALLPDGHDTLEYLPRMVEFHRNISEGILFPRWAPDLVRGAGEPLFAFNPPMIYYLAEFWHLVGFDFITALNLACIVLVIASSIGMFLLARLYFGDWGAWLATAAYLYAPYFAVDLYVRGALAEFAAFPFYAFALYGLGAYAQTRERRFLLIGTLAYAGILFSHNAAALFFTPLLLGFVLLTAWTERSWNVIANQVFGWLLGLGLAACVWIPSLAERQFVGLDRLLKGSLRYSNHFVSPLLLVNSPWIYGTSAVSEKIGISFSLGWSHLLLLVLVFGLALKFRKSADWRWLAFFFAALVVICFMMTSYAAPVWEHVALLQYVQFPWRLLGPACFCLALLIAPLGQLLKSLPRWRPLLFGLALALVIVPNLAHNFPRRYRHELLSEWAPERLAARGVEATTAFEYVPRWVIAWPIPFQGVRIVSGSASTNQTSRTVISWSGDVNATTPVTAELFITWFPGWTVLVDDHPVAAGPAETTGLIRFDIPAGSHHIEAVWKRTAPRWIGDLVSWLSLLTLAVMFLFYWRKPKPTHPA